jgi:hypothetical protein
MRKTIPFDLFAKAFRKTYKGTIVHTLTAKGKQG